MFDVLKKGVNRE